MRAPRTRTRTLGITLLLAAGVISVSAPAAMAGTASLNGTTTQKLVYQASRGESNHVKVRYGNGSFSVTDTAGVKAGQGCSALDGTHAACKASASVGQNGASVSLGRRNDSATVSGVGATLRGGPGRDRLKGSRHDDTLIGGGGNDRLDGGLRQDRIAGGAGNDRIVARDAFTDRVSCGRGRDRVKLDALDYFGDRCELVKRSDRPGATVLDLTTSDSGGGTARVRLGCPRDAVLGCRGRLSIRPQGRSRFGNAAFRLRRPGKSSVRVALPADVAKALRTGSIQATVVLRTRQGRLRRTVTVPQLLPGF
jgi:Ca2+-binding RTX toxin-like protein